MDIATQARNMMGSLIATKRHACQRDGGPADLSPMVQLVLADGEWAVALVPDRDAIGLAVDALTVERKAKPATIAYLADAYMRAWPLTPEGRAEAEARVRGDNVRDFEAGDMRVTECLVIAAIDVRTLEIVCQQVGYHYDDTGKPHFAKPEAWRMEDGAVLDVLMATAKQHQ